MRLEICESKSDWHDRLKEFPHDFYHTWDYYQTVIEVGHIARLFIITTDNFQKMAFPLIERPTSIDGKKDLVGAYGYAGPLFNFDNIQLQEELIDYFFTQLQSLNYVSLFARAHPTLNLTKLSCMEDIGEIVFADLSCGIDELYKQMRKDHRRDIKKLKKSDFQLKITTSPSERELDSFIYVYEETMQYLAANESYYFPRGYYESFFNSTEFTTYLINVEEPKNNTVVASALMVNCCDHFQYHLSGTLPDYYSKYPMKLILGRTLELAAEKGASFFVFGGGVGGKKDSLFDFKYGFTKRTAPFRAISKVLDRRAYDSLVKMKSEELDVPVNQFINSNYFPAYRNNNPC